MTTKTVAANSTGKVMNSLTSARLVDTTLRCAWTRNSIGILVNNRGVSFTLSNVRGSGGYLAQIRNCSSLSWTEGGSDSPTHQYGAYLGDVLSGDYAYDVTFKGLRFTHAVNQAIVRGMGCNLTFDGGRYDQSGNSGNEALQLRHGAYAVKYATVIGSIVVGPLEPGQAGREALAKYHKDNFYKPALCRIEGARLSGHVRVVGNSNLRVFGGETIASDPRGGSPSTCFNATTFASAFGTHRPSGFIENHSVRGFKYFAAPTFTIGPGCYLNGVKVPERKGRP